MSDKNNETQDFNEVLPNDGPAGVIEKRGLEILTPVTTDPVADDVAIAYITGSDPASTPNAPAQPTGGDSSDT
jgi:hypothetical protein